MMFIVTLIVFVLIFSLLILIHELGHFWAAKSSGVKVEEFGFGMPPKLWGKKVGETEYTINWIPFGGFVRMLGEDTGKGKKSPRSINNKSLRVQAWVIVAGVVMNFLLAFVLLTIGFLVGIEPLIVDQNDFNDSIKNGLSDVRPGFVVLNSEQDRWSPGDQILLDSEGSPYLSIESFTEARESDESLSGVTINSLYLSRLTYAGGEDSVFHPFLQEGDSIIQVNGMEILSSEDLMNVLPTSRVFDLLLYRPGQGEIMIEGILLNTNYPVVSYVNSGSPAEMAGLSSGDQIVSINEKDVLIPADVISVTEEAHAQMAEFLVYEILRDGTLLTQEIELDETGKIGVMISNPVPYYGDLSLYESVVPHSLMGLNKEQYGILKAPVVALNEMWRLGKLTAVMFMGVLGDFVQGGSVPDGVAGPVGIAQMTSVTLQAGFAALIRFVALLSLSLGVINILPLPALDGGRLVFVLFQAITGRRPNPKFEGIIHSIGFLFLMLFLVYITFNDVLNLF